MMRFCDCGLIERVSRHAIRVVDLDALRKKRPPASLLSAVFEKGRCRQEVSFARYARRNESVTLAADNGSFLCLQEPVHCHVPVQSIRMYLAANVSRTGERRCVESSVL